MRWEEATTDVDGTFSVGTQSVTMVIVLAIFPAYLLPHLGVPTFRESIQVCYIFIYYLLGATDTVTGPFVSD
jgi:hypothetical protein